MEEAEKVIESTPVKGGTKLTRHIMKAMGVFGGVQVLTMLFSLIRVKLLAVFAGTAGVGLLGIINSSIDMTYSATSLSLRNSSVRDIASEADDRHRHTIIAVLRRWSLIVGCLGLLVVLIASPLYSKAAFGSTDFTWIFVAVSIVMLFTALADGEKAVLQGLGKLKPLASSQIWGAALGLVACVPLFYFLRIDGIVPAVIACAATAAFAMWWFGRKAEPYSLRADVPWRDTWRVGRSFVKLGFFMMLSTFMGFLANYLFVMWLTHKGGINAVGLYQAGYTIVEKYAGLIFAAMAVEYYPRLACVIGSSRRTALYVSKQINVTIAVLLPVVVMMALFSSIIVELLYSKDFVAVVPFVTIALMGTILKAVSWSMAYVILAKGSGIVYFISETLSAVATLTINILGYHYGGLEGLGYAYIGGYLAYTAITYIVCRFYYKMKPHPSVWLYAGIAIAVCAFQMVAMLLHIRWAAILVAVAVGGAVVVWVWKTLSSGRKLP